VAKKWIRFPHADKAYVHDAADLKKHWPRLHKGDCEPFPKENAVQDAWRHFHAGEFAQAVEVGIAAGGAGVNAAVKAQVVYATLVEKNEKTRIALLEEAMGWAAERRAAAPKDPNAHYFFAFAAGRYSQSISVAKALAQGLGGKVKEALTTSIKLEPKHADAHIAYGSYQAEVIDKVGGIVAGMTYGAKKDSALEQFQKALKLNPDSAVARIEYANGLIMLFGKARIGDAERL
jgi:tetratricopeptide (TPR) repeat protein